MVAIVITAYNRAEPLAALLNSLNKMHVVDSVSIPLIISIDNHGTPEVNRVASDFKWKYGEKEVIIRQEKLGLVKHFMWVGDQTERFDHVLFLEDDLLVSPYLMDYTNQMIEYYEGIDEVAAGSLYNPMLNEATNTKFYQIGDGGDTYYLQHPYWGNIWFKDKWALFKQYLETYQEKKEILPRGIRYWNRSFKKIYIQFLIETGHTVVIPRCSLVTNNGCGGLHSSIGAFQYQVPMTMSQKNYEFIAPYKSLSRYDAFEEIYPSVLKKLNPKLRDFDFTVDIYGEKDIYSTPYVLTTKPVKDAIFSFSSLMKPTELGIYYDEVADGKLCLAPKEGVQLSQSFFKNRLLVDLYKNYYLFKPTFTEAIAFPKLYIKRILNHVLIKLKLKQA